MFSLRICYRISGNPITEAGRHTSASDSILFEKVQFYGGLLPLRY
jgi:hypothetical protein